MKTFKITYTGNSTKFKGLNYEVEANSEREAVENYYQMVMDSNYFPEEDGRILDCDGYEIASATSSTICFDGGVFVAEEIEDDLYALKSTVNDGLLCKKDGEYIISTEFDAGGKYEGSVKLFNTLSDANEFIELHEYYALEPILFSLIMTETD